MQEEKNYGDSTGWVGQIHGGRDKELWPSVWNDT